jgi:hypothetical protein
VIGVFASLLVVSAAFLATASQRGDYFVYGRYVDIATPLVIALAIAWLGSSPSARSLGLAAAALVGSFGGTWIVLTLTRNTETAKTFSFLDIFAILGWFDYPRNNPALLRATACTAGIGLAAIAVVVTRRARDGHVWRTTTVCVAVALVFVWQLSFVRPKVLTPLRQGAVNTQVVVSAIRLTRATEVKVGPTMAKLALALEYWLPGVRVRPTLPGVGECSAGLTLARSPLPSRNQVRVGRAGGFFMFRRSSVCRI